jgi:hypothetical protein
VTRVDLNEVADLVREAGYAAIVDQTGDNCATLYADLEPVWSGTQRSQPSLVVPELHGLRFQVVMGPGWFQKDGVVDTAWASSADVTIGPDDDGLSPDQVMHPENHLAGPRGYANTIIDRLKKAKEEVAYNDELQRRVDHVRAQRKASAAKGRGYAAQPRSPEGPLLDDLAEIALDATRKALTRLLRELDG